MLCLPYFHGAPDRGQGQAMQAILSKLNFSPMVNYISAIWIRLSGPAHSDLSQKGVTITLIARRNCVYIILKGFLKSGAKKVDFLATILILE